METATKSHDSKAMNAIKDRSPSATSSPSSKIKISFKVKQSPDGRDVSAPKSTLAPESADYLKQEQIRRSLVVDQQLNERVVSADETGADSPASTVELLELSESSSESNSYEMLSPARSAPRVRKNGAPMKSLKPEQSASHKIAHHIIKLEFSHAPFGSPRSRESSESNTENDSDSESGHDYVDTLVAYHRSKGVSYIIKAQARHQRIMTTVQRGNSDSLKRTNPQVKRRGRGRGRDLELDINTFGAVSAPSSPSLPLRLQ